MKLHYNKEINDRKSIAKDWAAKTSTDAIFSRRTNAWEVGTISFLADGIIEGTLEWQQVDELSYLLRDWEFANPDSKNEYMTLRLKSEAEQTNAESAIPDDAVSTASESDQNDTFGYADYDRMERPADGFNTTEAFGKLENLIASHKSLIMKSLGVGNLDFHEETDLDGKSIVAFYWLPKGTPDDLFMATLEMINHLCRKALELRNVDPTECPAADEQFEFSRFLHRIGMVGSVYKKQRKILMQNLSGSTWRKAVEERKARQALEGLPKGA